MTEYKPGDIAMVTGDRHLTSPAVYIVRPAASFWMWLDYGYTYLPVEIGPVLGNVLSIANAGGIDAMVEQAEVRGYAEGCDDTNYDHWSSR